MNSFEWFLLLMLAASLVVGPLMGFGAGRKAERRSRRHASDLRVTRIEGSNGVYIVTPSRAEAERFAAMHGGTILRAGSSE